MSEAASLYYAGQKAFAAGRTAEALEDFEAAYRTYPQARLLLHIARCQEALGRENEAARTRLRYATMTSRSGNEAAGAGAGADESKKAAAVGALMPGEDTPRDLQPGGEPKKFLPHQQWWFWAIVGGALLAAGGAAMWASRPEIVTVPPAGSLGTLDARGR